MVDRKLPEDVKRKLRGRDVKEVALRVMYRNHRGEMGERRIIPITTYFGEISYHKGEQWLVTCFDLDRWDYRTYAVKDIQGLVFAPCL